jgi:hypothetical protein
MKWVSLFLVLVIVSMSCQLFTTKDNKDGVVPGDLSQGSGELPIYDPEAPPPSGGAAALRALAILEPSVADLQGDVEAAERAALKQVIADLSAKTSTSSSIELPFAISQFEGAQIANLAPEFTIPMSYDLSSNFDGFIDTAHDVSLIAGLATGLSDILTRDMEAGANVSGSVTETEGSATNTSSLDLAKNADGSTKFGFGSKTETTKNEVSVKTEAAASVDGRRCPNADGQVSFTVKVRLGAESGGSGFTQDLTAFVRAEVGDDASIATTTIDVTQGTRQVKNGRQVYVETGATVKYNGENAANNSTSNLRLIRHSQDVTPEDVGNLSRSGHTAAFEMARTALLMSQDNWQGGGCVKIEATSPRTVKPGSTTQIPVKVIHRSDGSAVPSKLEAALSGGQSIDPTLLAKTPGTLTYTAPGETGKSATILLTATSKRGKAKLELSASTGGKFSASGNWGAAALTGTIDSLNNPFTLTSTGGGDGSCNGEVVFSGGSTRGEVSCSQTCAGLDFVGDGSYTITITENGGTISGDCSSYLPASGGLDIPDSEPINVTLQSVQP